MIEFAKRTSRFGWLIFCSPIFYFLYIKGGLGTALLGAVSALLFVIIRLWFWHRYRAQEYADSYCQEHDERKVRAFFVRGGLKIYYSYCQKCQEEHNVA